MPVTRLSGVAPASAAPLLHGCVPGSAAFTLDRQSLPQSPVWPLPLRQWHLDLPTSVHLGGLLESTHAPQKLHRALCSGLDCLSAAKQMCRSLNQALTNTRPHARRRGCGAAKIMHSCIAPVCRASHELLLPLKSSPRRRLNSAGTIANVLSSCPKLPEVPARGTCSGSHKASSPMHASTSTLAVVALYIACAGNPRPQP